MPVRDIGCGRNDLDRHDPAGRQVPRSVDTSAEGISCGNEQQFIAVNSRLVVPRVARQIHGVIV